MTELHMYTADDEEWVIASSSTDARDVYCSHIGCEPSADDPDGCDGGCHADHWIELPDGKTLTLREECQNNHGDCADPRCIDAIIRTTKTCAEWCAENGRGHWGSANA